MNETQKMNYTPPSSEVVVVHPEGIVCGSPGSNGDNMNPGNGSW